MASQGSTGYGSVGGQWRGPSKTASTFPSFPNLGTPYVQSKDHWDIKALSPKDPEAKSRSIPTETQPHKFAKKPAQKHRGS